MMRIILTVVLVVAPFAHAGDAWTKRREAFDQAAMAERKKLGLDDKKLSAQYPTPELSFGAGQTCIELCPGESKVVTLEGRFFEKGLVGIDNDAFTISNEKGSAKGWQGTIAVKPNTPPMSVGLEVRVPVTGKSQYLSGVVVGCKHTLALDVEGVTATAKLAFTECADRVTVPVEWKKGGKVLGTADYEVSRALNFSRVVSDAEMQATANAMVARMNGPDQKAYQTKLEAISKKLETCSTMPQDKMMKCIQGHTEAIQKLTEEQKKSQEAYERKNGLPFGCRSMRVDASSPKLEGDAQGCSGHAENESIAVTGRVTSP